MADIFISYASQDREWISQLASSLTDLSYAVWWDRKTPVGKSFHDIIEYELDKAKCVLVVWSINSVKSDWVKNEAYEGLCTKKLVPVLMHDVKPPLAFRHIQAANLCNWHHNKIHSDFNLLVSSIKNLVPIQSLDPNNKKYTAAKSSEYIPQKNSFTSIVCPTCKHAVPSKNEQIDYKCHNCGSVFRY